MKPAFVSVNLNTLAAAKSIADTLLLLMVRVVNGKTGIAFVVYGLRRIGWPTAKPGSNKANRKMNRFMLAYNPFPAGIA